VQRAPPAALDHEVHRHQHPNGPPRPGNERGSLQMLTVKTEDSDTA